MSLIETEETNLYTFEPFASHDFYTDVNRNLVKQTLAHLRTRPQDAPLTIVDMACGTGAVTRLIAEEIFRQGRIKHTRIVGVDPSAEAIRLADIAMKELGFEVQADFIQGESEDLPQLVHDVDVAFFCNAIHLVPDKLVAFQQVAKILAPQGIFGCNSAFYDGTYVPGTERFYRLWTRRAIGWLRQEHPDVRPSRDAKAQAMQWLTKDEYVADLKQSGFGDVELHHDNVNITLDGWRDIGNYWLFIEGALPGVPLSYAAKALGTAVYQAGEELQMNAVPRTWLQMVATKGK
jgi:ubiquinone/menaquinone biosynthesis C-methylase UbiE